jgi:ATPase
MKKTKLEEFFDETTMSVHLRENTYPIAKKGTPGNWEFIKIKNKVMAQPEIEEISKDIIETVEDYEEGFVEIERPGSTIVQLGTFRIVITRPPFSDGWEITAVRPVKHLQLDEYQLSEKLIKRLDEQAEGILISGAPGMGKSTFAAALIEHYADQGKIVKTVEAPRDLVLPDKITQYAISHGSSEEVHDVLLLSRPDYTLFDEMRNKDDFFLFADLRLSGIGLAGVVHATNPVDAIQRFVGKIDLGVIPHVIDTVIFIKDGKINKILSLQIEVKVPSGMTEADLARPIVTVKDFETNKLEYELYSYGEETVVIPVKDIVKKSTGALRLAGEAIKDEFYKYTDKVEVDVVSENKAIVKVPDYAIAGLIGKEGKHIAQIEERLGISIDIQDLDDNENHHKKKHKKGRR